MLEQIKYNGYIFQVDRDRMNLRFKGGSAPKLAPAPDPIPTPESIDLEVAKKGDAERRRLSGIKGRAGTILTETDNLGVTAQAKSPILGVTGGK